MTKQWKKTRDYFLNINPFCVECEKEGRLVPAQIVHHTLNINTELGWEQRLNPDYLEGMCISCHSKHHIKQGDITKFGKPNNDEDTLD